MSACTERHMPERTHSAAGAGRKGMTKEGNA